MRIFIFAFTVLGAAVSPQPRAMNRSLNRVVAPNVLYLASSG
ncbi:MAG: hypothetical protein WBC51_15340 [Vicinamibacterales bacterium]